MTQTLHAIDSLSLLDALPEAVFVLNTDGKILHANRTAVGRYGYSSDELLLMSAHELAPPELQSEVKVHLVHALESGDRFEWRQIAKCGKVIPVEIFAKPIYFAGTSAILSIVRDISARKRAEERQQIAASVFGHTHEGIVVTDAQGTVTEVNDAFTRITGYSRAEVLGRNMRILHSDRHDNAFYASMWDEVARTGVWRGEIWNRRKNGEVYPELLGINGRCPELSCRFGSVVMNIMRPSWMFGAWVEDRLSGFSSLHNL